MKKVHGLFLIVMLLGFFILGQSLTGSQISQKCHCDLTQSFCDFGCCCDTNCGGTISDTCFYGKSSFYCPKTQFFKSVKSSSTSSNNCYYYNTTLTVVGQQTLTSTQRTALITKNQEITPASLTLNANYKGYKMASLLTIGGKTAFSFAGSDGSCLTTAGTVTFGLRFGLNTKISCKCNNCGTPLLFSDLMGKNIPKYLDVTGNDIQIPSITDSAMTTLRINFVVGKYGSQSVKFIERMTYSYESDGSNIRNLYINFIDGDTIKQQQTSASFFPQIPLDMFYPIHVMS